MNLPYEQYLNDGQDPKAVEKIFTKVNDLMLSGETAAYIAVQKMPAVTLSPDCVVATNKRIIFCRPKSLGFSMEFQDFLWKDIAACHMKEEIFGAEFIVKSATGIENSINYLPKVQARKLYKFAQDREQEQIELRRQLDLEEKKAASGGISMIAPAPINEVPSASTNTEPETANQNALQALKKLKELLDHDLITQQDFDSKKSEILSRL